MPKIYIHTPLRPYTAKLDTVEVNAGTVGEALHALTSAHPDLKKLLYSEEGKLRSFVKVYLNDDDIRHLNDNHTTAGAITNAEQRRDPALFAPPDHARGRHGRPTKTKGREGPLHWNRRVGIAARTLSCRSWHRNPRAGGF